MDTKEEYRNRYEAALHAMQTGVAMEMQHDPKPTEPKHLRVGVNSALIDSGSIAQLLIDKGVISESEYVKALAEMMELEVEKYQKLLSEKFGVKINLG